MSETVVMPKIDQFMASVGIGRRAEADAHDLPAYGIDGIDPKLVVAVSSELQLAETLTAAHKGRLAVIPLGGRTHVGAGNMPERYDIALDLRSMNRITEYEPADLTVTVESGASLADLRRTLAVAGQHLPIDPPCDDSATIGGIVAANAYGPLRHAHGTIRDWLIGVRVVHADGTVSKAGGRVVKNVAGYEMTKLYVGSLGTLGVLSSMTFKLAPLPVASRTLVMRCNHPGDGAGFILALRDGGLAVQRAELLSPAAADAVVGRPGWCVLLDAAGSEAAVGRTLIDARAIAGRNRAEVLDVDADVWTRWREAFAPRGLAVRASVLPDRAAAIATELARTLAPGEARISATVAAGLVRAIVEPPHGATAATELTEQVRATTQRAGATLIVDAAPPEVKRAIDVYGPTRGDFAIMARLKQQFDPERVLSPGRFVGRL